MNQYDGLWGIDFGSKMAGTTVICYCQNDHIYFTQSRKNENADEKILQFVKDKSPTLIMIDAPLSLPYVYSQKIHETADFFYRQCDRELKAMSPMFLGGLTARAMKLNHCVTRSGILMMETYPAAQARKLGFKEYKTQNCHTLALMISQKYSLKLNEQLSNFHQLDAFMAFVGGIHYLQNQYEAFGNKEEGLIIV